MTRRGQRMAAVALVVAGVGVATALGLRAMSDNLLYYYGPAEIVAEPPPAERSVRMGGMVVDGSIERPSGSLTVKFDVTDYAATVPVTYTGVLPDLFRDGQGVVVRGRVVDGHFEADEVLAKHDEKYMPREVAEALAAARANDERPQ